jgi:hypothetical protein
VACNLVLPAEYMGQIVVNITSAPDLRRMVELFENEIERYDSESYGPDSESRTNLSSSMHIYEYIFSYIFMFERLCILLYTCLNFMCIFYIDSESYGPDSDSRTTFSSSMSMFFSYVYKYIHIISICKIIPREDMKGHQTKLHS